MLKWIEMLNKLYEEHPYTCNERVRVSYCPELDVVVVRVLDKYRVVEVFHYNDWGVLNKIQEVVNEMY